MAQSAFRTFQLLARPEPGNDDVIGVPYPSYESHRIGKNAVGLAFVFIRTMHSSQSPPVDIRMEQFEVRYSRQCSIRQPNGATEDDVFTILVCHNPDIEVTKYFFDIVSSLLSSFEAKPLPSQIASAIGAVVALFRALAQPQRRTAQGIWGELLLIAHARDPSILAAAWHADPDERHDFAAGPNRVEVKTASGRARSHYFSLEQLNPPGHSSVLIASIQTERSSGGTSVGDLLGEVCELLESSLCGRVRAVVSDSLGSALATSLEVAYDREMANNTLRYFEASSIPQIGLPTPPGVTEVEFRSDLSNAVGVTLDRYMGVDLFAALPQSELNESALPTS